MTETDDGLVLGPDGVRRCWWPGSDPLYVAYHDQEWGRPTTDDRYLFEKLCLEGFQAGLAWITILRKRENFRRAFDNFDAERIARYGAPEVRRLLSDEGIVRHRGKIEATIHNARCALEVRARHGSLYAWCAAFRPEPRKAPPRRQEIAAKTKESEALSKALRREGWRFVGPTTVYAWMQSVGMVNDHVAGCTSIGVRPLE
jgi:DNA-3-methyladenine glycosylase I